jgi:hypothetical protein
MTEDVEILPWKELVADPTQGAVRHKSRHGDDA